MIDLKSTGIEAALATADRLQAQDRDFAATQGAEGRHLPGGEPPGGCRGGLHRGEYRSPVQPAGHRAWPGRCCGPANRTTPATLLLNWLGKHPDDVVATEQLAEINIAAGNWDDAARYLELLLKEKPHDPVALNNLAWVYQQQGNDRGCTDAGTAGLCAGPEPADG